MKTTDERFLAVNQRIKEINYQKKVRQARLVTLSIGVFSVILICGIAIAMPAIVANMSNSEINGLENLGSVFYYGEARSYVLIALLGFLLGIFVTLLCTALQKRIQSDEDDQTDV
jgi:flagellar basal body-associated protein FliL